MRKEEEAHQLESLVTVICPFQEIWVFFSYMIDKSQAHCVEDTHHRTFETRRGKTGQKRSEFEGEIGAKSEVCWNTTTSTIDRAQRPISAEPVAVSLEIATYVRIPTDGC